MKYSENPSSFATDFVAEVAVCMSFSVAFLVLPELFRVNRLPAYLVSIVLLPLLFIRVGDAGTTMHPVAQYSLWYLRKGSSPSFPQFPSISVSEVFSLSIFSRLAGAFPCVAPRTQIAHILGPIAGGLLAGIMCLVLFPDDDVRWKRRNNHYSAQTWTMDSSLADEAWWGITAVDNPVGNSKTAMLVGTTITCK